MPTGAMIHAHEMPRPLRKRNQMPSGGTIIAGTPMATHFQLTLALRRAPRLVLEAAHGGDDVDRRHLDRRDDDGDEGERDAEAVADHERLPRDVCRDEVEVVAQRELQEHDDQAERGGDAQGRADGAGDQVVRHAFGDERLHEVAALRADGARHAHLRLTLGREHHEDHEDQHDAAGDREEAQDEEERGEHVARGLSVLDGVLLEGIDLDRPVAGAEQGGAFRTLEERLEAAIAASDAR